MRIRTFAGVGLGTFVLATGCQQRQHGREGDRHPPSEHMQGGDQDILPGRVKAAFTREFPNVTVQDVQKQTHPDGAVHWEVRYRAKDGQTKSAEFDADGELVSNG